MKAQRLGPATMQTQFRHDPGSSSRGEKNGGHQELEDRGLVGELWIKGGILHLHTSSVQLPHHPLLPEAFQTLLSPAFHGVLIPQPVSFCVREETSCPHLSFPCPAAPGHGKEQSSLLGHFFSIAGLCVESPEQ